MKVTQFIPDIGNLNSRKHCKDNWPSYGYSVVVFDGTRLREVINCTIYKSLKSNHCQLRVYGEECRNYGGAAAYGIGYHRPSSALQEAITAAGITLSESISARGDYLMREALRAIAERLYPCAKTLLIDF